MLQYQKKKACTTYFCGFVKVAAIVVVVSESVDDMLESVVFVVFVVSVVFVVFVVFVVSVVSVDDFEDVSSLRKSSQSKSKSMVLVLASNIGAGRYEGLVIGVTDPPRIFCVAFLLILPTIRFQYPDVSKELSPKISDFLNLTMCLNIYFKMFSKV
jgi:hypothetical protein